MRRITLNIRTTNETKNLLQQAANMLGTTVSGFLLNSASERAYDLIQNQTHFFLNDYEWNALCERLDCSPHENQKLKSLFN